MSTRKEPVAPGGGTDSPDELPLPVSATPVSPGMRVVGALVAIGALATIVAGTNVNLAGSPGTAVMLRVAWSARPERVEICTRVSDEELAKLPAHMRRRVVCEGTTARYRLEVSRDGVVLDTLTVRGGGMRHDREVYVSRELAVAPGAARYSVRFVRIDSSATVNDDDQRPHVDSTLERQGADSARQRQGADTNRTPALADRSAREDDERRRRIAQAIPPILAIDTTVTLAPRTVLLVTYDERQRRLVILQAP